MVTLIVLAGLVALPGTAHAAADSHQLATWNMQRGSTTERWQSLESLTSRFDTVALQEVPNAPPDGAVRQRNVGPNGSIESYTWTLGGSHRGVTRYLYILRQPSQNLGFITSWRPSQFRVIPGTYRDALAITDDRERAMFASVHARSGTGDDGIDLIGRTELQAYAGSYTTFAVLGDFNLDPRILGMNLRSVLGTRELHIYNSGQATQFNGGELDYMVSNLDTDRWQATAQNGIGSDHIPVAFSSLAAAGYYTTITSDAPEGGV
ncbi:MAG: hypothetical protein J2P26_08440, partial [Nocardiopsaceae bacterium]|nr:hypothetical protein [Nocardiopsaceae bacterium]